MPRPLPDEGAASLGVPGLGTPGWTCVRCRAVNPLSDDRCAGCGTSFAALLRAGGAARPPLGRGAQGIAAGAREATLVIGLFVVWKLASTVSLMQHDGAFARGRWIWRLERTLRLPSEIAAQRQILGHPMIVQALDVFYLAAHVGGMVALLPWLYLRHRERYRRWRNVVVAFTGLSLLVQLVSVAPPRLLPGLGFVDTAARYHQSAYQNLGPGLVDQLSSMPSIHVGWAVIVALAVIATSRSRWRWLIVAHPALTVYAVVVTANHFWLDAVAALALLGAIFAAERLLARRRTDHALPSAA